MKEATFTVLVKEVKGPTNGKGRYGTACHTHASTSVGQTAAPAVAKGPARLQFCEILPWYLVKRVCGVPFPPI